MINTILINIFLVLSWGFQTNQTANLNIQCSNIKEQKGTIRVVLYNQASGFLTPEKKYKVATSPVNSNITKVTVDNLPKGDYALFIYQDLNNDGICNLNAIGYPKEPFGFSNNLKPKFKKPGFDEAKIELNTDKTIQISLIN